MALAAAPAITSGRPRDRRVDRSCPRRDEGLRTNRVGVDPAAAHVDRQSTRARRAGHRYARTRTGRARGVSSSVRCRRRGRVWSLPWFSRTRRRSVLESCVRPENGGSLIKIQRRQVLCSDPLRSARRRPVSPNARSVRWKRWRAAKTSSRARARTKMSNQLGRAWPPFPAYPPWPPLPPAPPPPPPDDWAGFLVAIVLAIVLLGVAVLGVVVCAVVPPRTSHLLDRFRPSVRLTYLGGLFFLASAACNAAGFVLEWQPRRGEGRGTGDGWYFADFSPVGGGDQNLRLRPRLSLSSILSLTLTLTLRRYGWTACGRGTRRLLSRTSSARQRPPSRGRACGPASPTWRSSAAAAAAGRGPGCLAE